MRTSRRSLLGMLGSSVLGGRSNRSPNLILLQADYLGYSDTEPYGAADVRTPNLKRLAAEGIRFSNAYATAPLCAPSRAGLITGRYQARFGLEQNPPFGEPPSDSKGLPTSETTIAELIRSYGYATAMIGKWHLGFGPRLGPNARGFDQSLAFYDWSLDYFSHRTSAGKPALYENGQPVEIDGYSTDVFTDRAISFMERPVKKPFFIYLAYNATLPPYQPPSRPNDIRAKASIPVPANVWEKLGENSRRRDYVETVEALDAGIGRILDAIDRKRIADETIIVFTCDHGGAGPVRHSPLSHGFRSLYEGGIRVPCIVRWTGHIQQDKVLSDPMSLLDLGPTFLAAARPYAPARKEMDGINLLPLLRGAAPARERSLFWRQTFAPKQKAARRGRWKYLNDNGEMLFDLDSDPGETHNLALERPDLVAGLRNSLAQWESGMGREAH